MYYVCMYIYVYENILPDSKTYLFLYFNIYNMYTFYIVASFSQISVIESMGHFTIDSFLIMKVPCAHRENWDFWWTGWHFIRYPDAQTYQTRGELLTKSTFFCLSGCAFWGLLQTCHSDNSSPEKNSVEKYLFYWKKLNWFGKSFKEVVLSDQKCSYFHSIIRYINWVPPGETLMGRKNKIHFKTGESWRINLLIFPSAYFRVASTMPYT